MSSFPKGSPEHPVVVITKPAKPARVRTRTRTVYAVPGAENPEHKLGGSWSHKNPECPCPACRARRRKAQALALAAGEGWNAVSPESADALNGDGLVATETGTTRARIAGWLKLKLEQPDITLPEAARQLRTDRKTLNACILKAVEEGWLKFEDPISKIEYQIIPKVVRNLNRFLDEGDKTVTIETAKGTLFKAYAESKGISEAAKTVLALKIEMPEGSLQTPLITGQILGAPRVVVDDQPILTKE